MITERGTPFSDTCLKFTAIFCEIVIIFLGRNTSDNKFLDVTNKETKKVMWHRYGSLSIMNIEQLIFTWKGRYLVLALYASLRNSKLHIFYISYCDVMLKRKEFLWIFVR